MMFSKYSIIMPSYAQENLNRAEDYLEQYKEEYERLSPEIIDFDFNRYKRALYLHQEYGSIYEQLPDDLKKRHDLVINYLEEHREAFQEQHELEAEYDKIIDFDLLSRILYNNYVKYFVKRLIQSERFVIGYTQEEGKQQTAVFDTKGLGNAILPHLQDFGWEDLEAVVND